MRALVIYCHPKPDSFNAAILGVVTDKLREAGAEYRIRDLYRDTFEPVLSACELDGYLDCPANLEPVARDVEDVKWADTLVFVYPTWWYGLPAMLKGWLDRVLLPDVAFLMPDCDHSTIRPGLKHIKGMAVFTTCGASWWLTQMVGAPGKRTLFRGIGFLCAKPLRTAFAAHYLMDSSTPESRARHLARVGATMSRFTGSRSRRRPREATA
ncbi:NAD(P)H-dependent oxidoreductase [Actibacterium sp. 188UL27-1]|uniref:NAD(P)H-dependent oxidoreductase n=1 Tax=Actibacterium sp. 188UL27-1 TaxID=2786961 RepID=UPI001956B2A5|nr:NAD(P)H-dependent oxidoreductase [Actibacterium sp. 188UL27-1]MBM7069467.1 NAD(P)H-dependent oxidoreductase [Actibacterium sp. 188UL27-1]